jgi:hypothetical protein
VEATLVCGSISGVPQFALAAVVGSGSPLRAAESPVGKWKTVSFLYKTQIWVKGP